jgi:RNA polymerase sigma-70 factor (ECF subfamily)
MTTCALTAAAPCSAAAGAGGRVAEVSDADAASFQSVRPRLFGIAYRVLGCPSEAEDVVQDTWLRWQGTDRSQVRDAAAFLAATRMRLAINVRQCARARRETCVGPRFPDPVDARADPALDAERRDALELAVHMLIERLSPTERAAYVLRETFDYPYRDVSRALALSEANARQIVTRARRRLAGGPGRPVGTEERERLLDAFVAAAQAGDLATLERRLVADVGAAAAGDRVASVTRLPARRHDPVPVAA